LDFAYADIVDLFGIFLAIGGGVFVPPDPPLRTGLYYCSRWWHFERWFNDCNWRVQWKSSGTPSIRVLAEMRKLINQVQHTAPDIVNR